MSTPTEHTAGDDAPARYVYDHTDTCPRVLDPEDTEECYCPTVRVIPSAVPRDHVPRNYAEQRALLDDSLRDIPSGETE